jgi:hypothetical protein
MNPTGLVDAASSRKGPIHTSGMPTETSEDFLMAPMGLARCSFAFLFERVGEQPSCRDIRFR